jgi:hypothetical protein
MEIVRGEVKRVGVGQQLGEALCDGLAVVLADADVDLARAAFPMSFS